MREQVGDSLKFTALRDIAEGEELSFSYVPVTISRTERRKLLQEYFHFGCACARCSREDPHTYGHDGCGGSWNARDACAICGTSKSAARATAAVAP